MRVCKKIALMVMVFIMLSTLNVFAETGDILLDVSSKEIKTGDKVKVTLSAKLATGIEGIDATLQFDKTKLKLTNESSLATDDFLSMSGTNDLTGDFKLSILYTGTSVAPTESNFAILEFEVLDTVTDKETLDIKLYEIEIGDSEDNWIEIEDKIITLIVTEEQDTDNGIEDENQDAIDDEQNKDDENQELTDNEQNQDNENQEVNNSEENKDDTIADKIFNKAGLKHYSLIFGLIVAVIIISKKVNEYKDI